MAGRVRRGRELALLLSACDWKRGLMAEAWIQVGGMYGIGAIGADPADLRGTGGVLSPALELALEVRLNPQPDGDLAVKQLSVELWLPLAAHNAVALGPKVTHTWPGGLCSGRKHMNKTSTRLRFALSHEQLRLLEQHAARSLPGAIQLEFRFSTVIAWARWASNEIDRTDPNAPAHPFPVNYGVLVDVGAEFQTSSSPSDALTLYVGREQWAEQILPAVGLDRLRLIAVRLPSDGPLPKEVVRLFDEARRHYDEGRYKDAIKSCRDLRYAVEAALGAVKGRRVATVVAEQRRTSSDGPLYKFVDGVWTALVDLTDDASHPDLKVFTRVDARACLLLTATLVEALTDVLTDGTDLTRT
jgi:hypothetical protein